MTNRCIQRFTPLKRSAKPRKVAAFDTEGDGDPGGFLCGAVVSEAGRYLFYDPAEMLAYLTSPPLRDHWLVAHNLEYDLAVLTGGDLTMLSCLFVDARLLVAETQDGHGHKWKFIDSTNLFPGCTVAQLGEMLGIPKMDAPPLLADLVEGKMIIADLSQDRRDRLTAYNLRDAEIVYRSVMALQEELLRLGGMLQITVAGCSMDLFRRAYLQQSWPTPHAGLNSLCRGAYYGARTEPYALGYAAGVNGYDVSSLYPSIQRSLDFPHPGRLTMELATSEPYHRLTRPGCSQVAVHVPDQAVPPLPSRQGRHLYFPTGDLHGIWTHNELLHACECGARITALDWSLSATESFNPFRGFIDDLYARKVLHASDDPVRAALYKLMLNSSYGRYGVSPDSSLTTLFPIRPDTDWDALAGSELHLINGWPYALTPVGEERQPAYSYTLMAAYISAGARISMQQRLSGAASMMIYTDTDSLWLQGETATSDGIGGLRQIEENVDLWVVAPKEYAVFSGESLIQAHAKGIPESLRLLYLQQGVAEFQSPVGIREAARTHHRVATWVDRLRHRQYAVPKRAPIIPPGAPPRLCSTRPWTVPELDSLAQGSSRLPPLRLEIPAHARHG